MDSNSYDGLSGGSCERSGWPQGRPPPQGGRKLPLKRGGSREAGPLVRKDSLGSTAELQRRGSVQKLLDHLGAFANDVNDTHEGDFTDLLHNMQESEHVIKTLLDEEVKDREQGDKALDKRCASLEKVLAALQNGESGPLKQRVDSLENTFAAWADKHTRDVEALRKENDALSRQLANYTGAHKQHLEAEDRLESAVKSLASRGDSTARALAAAEAKLDHLHEGVHGCEQTCAAADSKSSALGERLKEAERRLDNSLRSCSKDLDQLKGDHGDLSHQVKQRMADTHSLINQQLASHKAKTDAIGDSHHELLSKHQGQARDLQGLMDENSKHRKDVTLLRQHVEGALGELAQNTASELKATRDDLDQILGLLSGVQKAWRPGTSRSQGPRRKRISDEGSPKTPKEVNIDLLRHTVEPRTPKASTPHLL